MRRRKLHAPPCRIIHQALVMIRTESEGDRCGATPPANCGIRNQHKQDCRGGGGYVWQHFNGRTHTHTFVDISAASRVRGYDCTAVQREHGADSNAWVLGAPLVRAGGRRAPRGLFRDSTNSFKALMEGNKLAPSGRAWGTDTRSHTHARTKHDSRLYGIKHDGSE